jgi:hypothetical protein
MESDGGTRYYVLCDMLRTEKQEDKFEKVIELGSNSTRSVHTPRQPVKAVNKEMSNAASA